MLPDLLYLVGTGSTWEDTEELRYSLRSVHQHLPHRRVLIVGHRPGWLSGVHHILAGDRFEHPVRNTLAKLALAVNSDLLAERFVLMNDDFLVLQPVDPIGHYSLGLMQYTMPEPSLCTADYRLAFQATLAKLLDAGVKSPFNYETHHPFPMCRSGVLSMMQRFGGPGQLYAWRSAYANWQPSSLDTVVSSDVKVRGTFSIPHRDQQFLSLSNDTPSDGLFRAWIRTRFPVASPYERQV